jgi:DNA-binding NarL/FixJ family response regulator
MKRKRILIADAHSTMLASLRVLLKDTFDVVFMVADDQSLIEAVARTDPDLVIADLSIQVSSGENVARLLHRVSPELRVIILSVHDEQTVVDECLAAGAKGFVLKRTAAIDLIPAIRAVLSGDTYVSPSVVTGQGNIKRQPIA